MTVYQQFFTLFLSILFATAQGQSGFNVALGTSTNETGYLTVGKENNFHLALSNFGIQGKSKIGQKYARLKLNHYGGNVIVGGVDPNTRLGIGLSNPVTTLHIKGISEAGLTGNGHLVIGNYLTKNLVMDDNEIQARDGNQAAPLRLNESGGGLFSRLPFIGDHENMQYNSITGEIGYDNSSRRYKIKVGTLTDDWTKIFLTRPVKYTRARSPEHWEYGYIAEEMDSIGLNNLVGYDLEGIPSDVKYDRIVIYLTELMKIHQKEIDGLHKKIARLERRIRPKSRSRRATKSSPNFLHFDF